MSGEPSWGRLPNQHAGETTRADWRFHSLPEARPILAVGARRSYGDVGLNTAGVELLSSDLNRFIEFDRASGILHCEAGVLLADILAVIVPAGWFIPVLPGTGKVSLGGAVANDIHGKNHGSAGSFGCHVLGLTLQRSDYGRVHCSPTENAELFAASIAGLGLTGQIVSVELQLQQVSSPSMDVQELPFNDLNEYLALVEDSKDWIYTVAWLDGHSHPDALSGVFTRGCHSGGAGTEQSSMHPKTGGLPLSVPLVPPFNLVADVGMGAFNKMYAFVKGRNRDLQRVSYSSFFFPLDAVNSWNKLYGPAGFYQYQCVVPLENGLEAIQQVFECTREHKQQSTLVVLKDFGAIESPGLLSFPRCGYTLAMDFSNKGAQTLSLFGCLDDIVRSSGGALYPAKDARMPAAMFAQSFPKLAQFRGQLDPAFESDFWRRVGGQAI